MIEQENKLPYFELTGGLLNCCFEVMKELGPGFLENFYKNARLSCENLGKEHQAQLFNYLKVSQLPVGLLINFRRGKLEWKRLQRNQECIIDVDMVAEPASF